jgi:protein arginine kinase activator
MKCDKCKKNEAVLNIFEIEKDGVKLVRHLCEECAKTEGIDDKISTPIVMEPCPRCGSTYDEVFEKMEFGCDECYRHFRPILSNIFKKIQNSEKFGGKVIKQVNEALLIKMKLRNLKKKLEKLIELEDYEEAVKVRDKIAKYEEELKIYENN